MPYPQAPAARILEAMKTIAMAADVHLAFGLSTPFKVRHARHRRTTAAERPCVSLVWSTKEIDEGRGGIHAHSEVCWIATVDIVVDLELPSEDSGEDPTGWNQLEATANAFANLFLAEASPLRLLVDDIQPADGDPDEDSKPDDGRLVQSVDVLYRTLWNDLNHLLTSEENAP